MFPFTVRVTSSRMRHQLELFMKRWCTVVVTLSAVTLVSLQNLIWRPIFLTIRCDFSHSMETPLQAKWKCRNLKKRTSLKSFLPNFSLFTRFWDAWLVPAVGGSSARTPGACGAQVQAWFGTCARRDSCVEESDSRSLLWCENWMRHRSWGDQGSTVNSTYTNVVIRPHYHIKQKCVTMSCNHVAFILQIMQPQHSKTKMWLSLFFIGLLC